MRWLGRIVLGATLGALCGPCAGALVHVAQAPSGHRAEGWRRLQDLQATCTVDELGQRAEDSQGASRVCMPLLSEDRPAGTVLDPSHVLPVWMPADYVPGEAEWNVVGRTLRAPGFTGEMLRAERLQ